MSFGKKGLAAGAAAAAPGAVRTGPRPATPARPAPPPADPYAAQREAFLAAERARARANGEQAHAYDDSASAFTNTGQRSRSNRRSSGLVFGDPENRSLLVAYVLWWFCAPIGLHRIYCGSKETAIYQMALFFGGFVVLFILPPLGMAALIGWLLWVVVDMFLIPGLMRRFKAQHSHADSAIFA